MDAAWPRNGMDGGVGMGDDMAGRQDEGRRRAGDARSYINARDATVDIRQSGFLACAAPRGRHQSRRWDAADLNFLLSGPGRSRGRTRGPSAALHNAQGNASRHGTAPKIWVGGPPAGDGKRRFTPRTGKPSPRAGAKSLRAKSGGSARRAGGQRRALATYHRKLRFQKHDASALAILGPCVSVG